MVSIKDDASQKKSTVEGLLRIGDMTNSSIKFVERIETLETRTPIGLVVDLIFSLRSRKKTSTKK
jgi:hypothetical protein